jgi:hypothetical protein
MSPSDTEYQVTINSAPLAPHILRMAETALDEIVTAARYAVIVRVS